MGYFNIYGQYVNGNDELYHHGILGMRWGKKNGPPYPLNYEDHSADEKKALKQQKKDNKEASKGNRNQKYLDEHVIKAGTKIYRTSANPQESEGGPKYVSYLDADRNLYKGGYIRNTSHSDKAYEYEYSLTEDLKVPSRDTLNNAIMDVLSKNPGMIDDMIKKHIDIEYREGSYQRAELIMSRSFDSAKQKTDKQVMNEFFKEQLKEIGNKPVGEACFYASQTFGKNHQLRDKVIKELKAKGYNAITDEASVGQHKYDREGVDPLIVFDSKVLRKTHVKEISRKEEDKSYGAYEKWRRKAINSKNDGWTSRSNTSTSLNEARKSKSVSRSGSNQPQTDYQKRFDRFEKLSEKDKKAFITKDMNNDMDGLMSLAKKHNIPVSKKEQIHDVVASSPSYVRALQRSGMTYKEIAKKIGMSESSVYSLLNG